MIPDREITAKFSTLESGQVVIDVSGLPGEGCEFTPAGLAELATVLSDIAKSAKQSQITKAVRGFKPLKGLKK